MKKHFIHLFSALLLSLVIISVPTIDDSNNLESEIGTCVDLEDNILEG